MEEIISISWDVKSDSALQDGKDVKKYVASECAIVELARSEEVPSQDSRSCG